MSKRVKHMPDGLHHFDEDHQQDALSMPEQGTRAHEPTPVPHQPNDVPAADPQALINIYLLDQYEVLPGTPRSLLIGGMTVDLMRLTHAQFSMVISSPAGNRLVRKK